MSSHPAPRLPVTTALLSILLLVGCLPTSLVESKITPPDRARFPDGDPARGRTVLLNETFARMGIPLSVLVGARRFAPAMEAPSLFSGRRGLNRMLPVASTAFDLGGVTVVNGNCFTCHSGMVDGKLYLGLGNSFMDTTADLRDSPLLDDKFVERLNLSMKELTEFRRWKSATLPYARYLVTTSPGTSSAVAFTSYFLAHRTPGTYEWSEAPLADIPDKVVETDIPALWLAKKKQGLYYGGEATGNRVRHLMQFFSAPGSTLADLEAAKDDFQDVLAYMSHLQPPRYPYDVDQALVLQGRSIFDENCSSCHGTYGPEGVYPDMIVPIWKVGTDPERWNLSRHPGAIDHYNSLWHGQDGATMALTEGYSAPPLEGVWATAPYLHNASIPSLEDLLRPESERPRYFIRSWTSRSYDPRRVGWQVEILPHGKEGEKDPGRRIKIYDTDQFGKSNRGHLFGTELPSNQRQALLEYLKSL